MADCERERWLDECGTPPNPRKVGIYEVKTRDGGQLLAKWEDRTWWIHGTGPGGLRVRRQLDGMSAVTAYRTAPGEGEGR